MSDAEKKIRDLAKKYRLELAMKVNDRVAEMQEDRNEHFLIYKVLGVSFDEGQAIDIYQNKGRFLYKYAGSFLESAAEICFKTRYPESIKKRIPNTEGTRPKTYEIDCLVNNLAHEIKWRDATTDGDHITKEHSRAKACHDAGYVPVRVMFYYPVRSQAMKIQKTLETLYQGLGGQYYHSDAAWDYIHNYTGVNLLEILHKIADENVGK